MAPLGVATLVLGVAWEVSRQHPVTSLAFPTHICLWPFLQGSHLPIKGWNVGSKVRPITTFGLTFLHTLMGFIARPCPLFNQDILYTIGKPLKTPFQQ